MLSFSYLLSIVHGISVSINRNNQNSNNKNWLILGFQNKTNDAQIKLNVLIANVYLKFDEILVCHAQKTHRRPCICAGYVSHFSHRILNYFVCFFIQWWEEKVEFGNEFSEFG